MAAEPLLSFCFGIQVVHPKTDDQRKRLAEAVSKSFLFRTLEPEQYDEVLDAIFERNVSMCVHADGGEKVKGGREGGWLAVCCGGEKVEGGRLVSCRVYGGEGGESWLVCLCGGEKVEGGRVSWLANCMEERRWRVVGWYVCIAQIFLVSPFF